MISDRDQCNQPHDNEERPQLLPEEALKSLWGEAIVVGQSHLERDISPAAPPIPITIPVKIAAVRLAFLSATVSD